MELTKEQLARQDEVDNAIYRILCILAGCDPDGYGPTKYLLDWNMEHIGLIRDAFQEVICDKLHLMTEMEFYPYIEE